MNDNDGRVSTNVATRLKGGHVVLCNTSVSRIAKVQCRKVKKQNHLQQIVEILT